MAEDGNAVLTLLLTARSPLRLDQLHDGLRGPLAVRLRPAAEPRGQPALRDARAQLVELPLRRLRAPAAALRLHRQLRVRAHERAQLVADGRALGRGARDGELRLLLRAPHDFPLQALEVRAVVVNLGAHSLLTEDELVAREHHRLRLLVGVAHARGHLPLALLGLAQAGLNLHEGGVHLRRAVARLGGDALRLLQLRPGVSGLHRRHGRRDLRVLAPRDERLVVRLQLREHRELLHRRLRPRQRAFERGAALPQAVSLKLHRRLGPVGYEGRLRARVRHEARCFNRGTEQRGSRRGEANAVAHLSVAAQASRAARSSTSAADRRPDISTTSVVRSCVTQVHRERGMRKPPA